MLNGSIELKHYLYNFDDLLLILFSGVIILGLPNSSNNVDILIYSLAYRKNLFT